MRTIILSAVQKKWIFSLAKNLPALAGSGKMEKRL
jgi:hypothetical protein